MKFKVIVLGLMLLVSNSVYVLAADENPKVEEKTAEVAKYCPVCGPNGEVEGLALSYKYEGKKHSFCSLDCLKEFKQNPEKYLKAEAKS